MIALATGPGVVVAVGLKVSVRTQVVPPGETVSTTGRVGHVVFVIVKGSAAGIAMVETVSAAVVLGLLIVTVCVALVVVSSWPANVRFVGLNVMAPAVALPVPVSVTVSGWPGSKLSGVVRIAAFGPAAEGVYVTPNVQDDPPGSISAAVQVPPADGALKSAGLPTPPEASVIMAVNGKVTAVVVLFVIVKKNG